MYWLRPRLGVNTDQTMSTNNQCVDGTEQVKAEETSEKRERRTSGKRRMDGEPLAGPSKRRRPPAAIAVPPSDPTISEESQDQAVPPPTKPPRRKFASGFPQTRFTFGVRSRPGQSLISMTKFALHNFNFWLNFNMCHHDGDVWLTATLTCRAQPHWCDDWFFDTGLELFFNNAEDPDQPAESVCSSVEVKLAPRAAIWGPHRLIRWEELLRRQERVSGILVLAIIRTYSASAKRGFIRMPADPMAPAGDFTAVQRLVGVRQTAHDDPRVYMRPVIRRKKRRDDFTPQSERYLKRVIVDVLQGRVVWKQQPDSAGQAQTWSADSAGQEDADESLEKPRVHSSDHHPTSAVTAPAPVPAAPSSDAISPAPVTWLIPKEEPTTAWNDGVELRTNGDQEAWTPSFGEDYDNSAEVTLAVGGKKIRVRKESLCRHLTVFKDMDAVIELCGNGREEFVLSVKDVEHDDFVRFLVLTFSRTAVLEASEALLELSRRFKNETALRRCEQFLEEKMAVLDVGWVLYVAEKYDMKKVLDRAIESLDSIQSVHNVMRGEYYKELSEQLSLRVLTKFAKNP